MMLDRGGLKTVSMMQFVAWQNKTEGARTMVRAPSAHSAAPRPSRSGPQRRGRLLLAQLEQLALVEGQLAARGVHDDRVAGLELALQDRAREPGLDHALDRAP